MKFTELAACVLVSESAVVSRRLKTDLLIHKSESTKLTRVKRYVRTRDLLVTFPSA
jgi:hypothetical protein